MCSTGLSFAAFVPLLLVVVPRHPARPDRPDGSPSPGDAHTISALAGAPSVRRSGLAAGTAEAGGGNSSQHDSESAAIAFPCHDRCSHREVGMILRSNSEGPIALRPRRVASACTVVTSKLVTASMPVREPITVAARGPELAALPAPRAWTSGVDAAF